LIDAAAPSIPRPAVKVKISATPSTTASIIQMSHWGHATALLTVDGAYIFRESFPWP
jgi:hypothetical protein